MSKPHAGRAPRTYDELRAAIANRHGELSKRLRQNAEFALTHPNDMALETVAEIAKRAQVQPSSLIRFAKAFDYEGFSAMQRVFRARLTEGRPSYGDRIKALKDRGGRGAVTPIALLDEFAQAATHALDHLREAARPDLLERAVRLLAGARVIQVVGQRRAFPVAAYLGYALSQLDRRVVLLDGVGGMVAEQASVIAKDDALIAVSFHPYAPDTLKVARAARQSGASVIALSDGPLSPLGGLADVLLEIEEAQVRSFRALSASMCLALALVVALGHRLDQGFRPNRALAES
jgi:DNA-binding MurR/RpiR family transcriptional regulator